MPEFSPTANQFAPGNPRKAHIAVVIPALNEEESIARVVREVVEQNPDEIIVVDNGSSDRTAEVARQAGAWVVSEPRRGYGRACRCGVQAAKEADVLVFLDGDGSDCAYQMPLLLQPVRAGEYDLVLGSRIRGKRERGSMNFQQVLGGRTAGFLLQILYGVRHTDMGPFRAIRCPALERLGMREEMYGWNLEMQMRAARAGLRILEIPVDHRLRAGGHSKVSGNLKGTILAAVRIVVTFVRVALQPR